MSRRQPPTLVRDMLDSAERIVRLVDEMTEGEFVGTDNAAIQDAVSYRLVVIGEAAASLLAKCPEYCLAHPEVPWKSARAMRNFVVHDYMNLGMERVWETAVTSTPELIDLSKASMKHLLTAYPNAAPAPARSAEPCRNPEKSSPSA